MHLLNIATALIVISLVGVEFSVAAFIDPAAWQLDPQPQLKLLSRVASVLGRVMPGWYAVSTLLLGIQVWVHWQTPGRDLLVTASAVWVLASVASIIFLVPLNTRVANGDPDWQPLHRIWDKRHRARTAILGVTAVLALDVLMR